MQRVFEKSSLFQFMPIVCKHLLIRPQELADAHRFAAWPSYPFPYEPFNPRYGRLSCAARQEAFRSRQLASNNIAFAVDSGNDKGIASLTLAEIDWQGRTVGNMGFRVHPAWCDKGIGTATLRAVSTWCFERGFHALRLDEAASNVRAVRCYQKCGFAVTGEFFRDPNLEDADVSLPEYDFLRPHLVVMDGKAMLRFHWMERSQESQGN